MKTLVVTTILSCIRLFVKPLMIDRKTLSFTANFRVFFFYLSHTCGVYCPYDNLSIITGVMLYQALNVGTTFDTIHRFDTSVTLLFRSIDTITFVNDKYISSSYVSITSCEGKVGEI